MANRQRNRRDEAESSVQNQRIRKRDAENGGLLSIVARPYRCVRQFINRLRNLRRYKYFKCPQCHSRLRLPRKVGKVTVTCGMCHHSFKQRA